MEDLSDFTRQGSQHRKSKVFESNAGCIKFHFVAYRRWGANYNEEGICYLVLFVNWPQWFLPGTFFLSRKETLTYQWSTNCNTDLPITKERATTTTDAPHPHPYFYVVLSTLKFQTQQLIQSKSIYAYILLSLARDLVLKQPTTPTNLCPILSLFPSLDCPTCTPICETSHSRHNDATNYSGHLHL